MWLAGSAIGCPTFKSQKRKQSPQVPISQASINEHFLCLHSENEGIACQGFCHNIKIITFQKSTELFFIELGEIY